MSETPSLRSRVAGGSLGSVRQSRQCPAGQTQLASVRRYQLDRMVRIHVGPAKWMFWWARACPCLMEAYSVYVRAYMMRSNTYGSCVEYGNPCLQKEGKKVLLILGPLKIKLRFAY
jgi:hypothetical protein